ncbi:MAG: ABC transporter permease [Bacteroidota bacterium]
MLKSLSIFQNSLRLTFKELKVNKQRTALSLTGMAFGIFCIIGVLTTVNSLEQNIQNEVKGLGSNTIYIDKWDYSGGPNKPMWKYRSRPVMKNEEAALIKERSLLAGQVTYLMQSVSNISYKDEVIENGTVYCINEDQIAIQPIQFEAGRYFSSSEFTNGTNNCIIGYTNAEDLFGSTERALGRQVDVKGKKITIIGVIKKEGKSFIGWDYDKCIMITNKFARQLFDPEQSNPILIVKGKENVTTDAISQELRGIMRQIRRLSPLQEDNFSLNSVEAFSKAISESFVTINIVGSIIGGISLIVGMFGIANIMFVTVKERTPVIGLKKAIGAKRSTILFEFLLEASILCILGGAIGLFFVYILTLILSGPLEFPVYLSGPMILTTVIICLVIGVLAGIIPASRAAKMDPVKAIRS